MGCRGKGKAGRPARQVLLVCGVLEAQADDAEHVPYGLGGEASLPVLSAPLQLLGREPLDLRRAQLGHPYPSQGRADVGLDDVYVMGIGGFLYLVAVAVQKPVQHLAVGCLATVLCRGGLLSGSP